MKNGMSVQLWKVNEERAKKNGVHKTIYWVKKNKNIFVHTKSFKISSKYQGDWSNNQKCGFGIQNYSNGNRYEGEWLDGKRNGRGTLWILNNRKKLIRNYTGLWKDNMKSGEGTMFFENGDRYDGFWAENKMSGYGRLVQNNQDVYVGQWYDGKRNGYGFLTKNNGDNFEGFWVNNKREGSGSYFFNEKKKLIVGEWEDDCPKSAFYADIQGVEVKNSLQLPSLMLEDLSELIHNLFNDVRLHRLKYRVTKTPLDFLLSEVQLNELQSDWNLNVSRKVPMNLENYHELISIKPHAVEEEELESIWKSFGVQDTMDFE